MSVAVTLAGSAAAAAPWSPAALPGLLLWLDAAAGCYQDAARTVSAGDGDVVGGWSDLSGNGRHATQATPEYKPVRWSDGAGGWLLQADGIDDSLLVASLAATAAAGYTLGVRLQLDSGTEYPMGAVLNPGNVEVRGGGFDGSIQAIAGAAVLTPGGSDAGVERSVILEVGATSSLTVGPASGTAAGGADATLLRLGSRSGTNYPWPGSWRRVVVFERLLTAPEKARVITYLNTGA